MKYYGQYEQDKVLNKIFKGKENGVFVDIGAHDGVTFSNSLFFEESKNWRGICVEPIPEVFQKLDEARKCIKVNGVISDKEGSETFLRVHGEVVDTEMLSGILSDYDQRHLDRIDRELKEYGGEKEEITVACYNINTLLEENGLNQVDFFTIDTEGNELKILKTINFEAFDIDVLIVENNYESSENKEFMESKGYKRIKTIGHDEIFRKTENLTFFQRS
jgi:FkbM family methyltransferase